MRLELGDDMGGIVVEDNRRPHASPRPLSCAVAELDDHHVRRLEHVARDPERRREPVRLDAVVQG